jgi:hypothetical protein
MIGSFKGRFAEAITAGRSPKGFSPDLVRSAQRKLAALIAPLNCSRWHRRPAIASRR